MSSIEQKISELVAGHLSKTYGCTLKYGDVQIQKTRKEFEGDLTIVVFPLLGKIGKPAGDAGEEIGRMLLDHCREIKKYNVVKGFLNLIMDDSFWLMMLDSIVREGPGLMRGEMAPGEKKKIMIEFSSPNTNKPLHLGHIRNNLIGYSLSRILTAVGHRVIRANLVNDRGIHISKSMLAWEKWGNGETPGSTGKKGDHLVGDYYVKFEQEYRKQVREMMAKGTSRQEAEKNAPLILEAQELLRKWEAGDDHVIKLWNKMNGWVYEGFNRTYDDLGIEFDRIYHESETYKLGKQIIMEGLRKGVLYQKENGSIWADLSGDGLDHKLLLRADGTSVYMTQDVGTAKQRFDEYNLGEHIYVVGNEQNYHFQALKIVLKKLGFDFADHLYHLSYGMVELPEGKMKSREGTVVDADDIIFEMNETARQMSFELGKLDGYSTGERENTVRIIGLGALKYFILKVDPRKNMVFDPGESIDFNGNTGPFIQYTYARVRSVSRKAGNVRLLETIPPDTTLNDKERELIKLLSRLSESLIQSGESLNPSLLANYLYILAKEYNQFYHDYSILKAEEETKKLLRLKLTWATGETVKTGMQWLGIEVPERM